MPVDESKTCQHCKWFLPIPFGAQTFLNSVRQDGMGTCHVRSQPGAFPERLPTDWCGEFKAKAGGE